MNYKNIYNVAVNIVLLPTNIYILYNSIYIVVIRLLGGVCFLVFIFKFHIYCNIYLYCFICYMAYFQVRLIIKYMHSTLVLTRLFNALLLLLILKKLAKNGNTVIFCQNTALLLSAKPINPIGYINLWR